MRSIMFAGVISLSSTAALVAVNQSLLDDKNPPLQATPTTEAVLAESPVALSDHDITIKPKQSGVASQVVIQPQLSEKTILQKEAQAVPVQIKKQIVAARENTRNIENKLSEKHNKVAGLVKKTLPQAEINLPPVLAPQQVSKASLPKDRKMTSPQLKNRNNQQNSVSALENKILQQQVARNQKISLDQDLLVNRPPNNDPSSPINSAVEEVTVSNSQNKSTDSDSLKQNNQHIPSNQPVADVALEEATVVLKQAVSGVKPVQNTPIVLENIDKGSTQQIAQVEKIAQVATEQVIEKLPATKKLAAKEIMIKHEKKHKSEAFEIPLEVAEKHDQIRSRLVEFQRRGGFSMGSIMENDNVMPMMPAGRFMANRMLADRM